MAYTPYTPESAEGKQALENWFLRAMEQKAEREAMAPPADSLEQNPFPPVMPRALPENYAQSSSGTVLDLGRSAPRDDPWQTGGHVLRREVQPDGTTLVTKRVPAWNGLGEQSSAIVREVEIPDYLNPAKIKELEYRKRQQELQPKAMAPQLVDGQWVYPPSAERPGGAAYPVEGFQRRTATDAKVELEREQKTLAKERVSSLVDELTSNYQSLAEKNALVSPSQPAWQNIRARLAASGAGQLVSGAVGTEEQSIRDEIATKIPALFNEIRAVTGLSAKAIDSNAELQFFKQTATDPTKSLEANLEALRSIENRYGLGRSGLSEAPAQAPSTSAPAGGQQIRDQGAYIEADGKRYIVIRRNPDGSAVIRDPQTGRTGTMRQ